MACLLERISIGDHFIGSLCPTQRYTYQHRTVTVAPADIGRSFLMRYQTKIRCRICITESCQRRSYFQYTGNSFFGRFRKLTVFDIHVFSFFHQTGMDMYIRDTSVEKRSRRLREPSFPNYVYWYGYKTVNTREAFTPALDYPAPIESAQLLKIQLYPTFRAYEIIGADDPGCGQWAPIERTINSPSISGHEFAPINTTHADAQGISCTLTSVSNMTRLDTKNPLLAPYTEGDTMLLLPFTESAAIAAKMMDRTFIKYKFYAKTQPNKVKISSFYNKPNLQIESTFSKSIITLTKRHPDRSAEDL